jgi:hypothetical protein
MERHKKGSDGLADILIQRGIYECYIYSILNPRGLTMVEKKKKKRQRKYGKQVNNVKSGIEQTC